jgi:hypothetical protein
VNIGNSSRFPDMSSADNGTVVSVFECARRCLHLRRNGNGERWGKQFTIDDWGIDDWKSEASAKARRRRREYLEGLRDGNPTSASSGQMWGTERRVELKDCLVVVITELRLREREFRKPAVFSSPRVWPGTLSPAVAEWCRAHVPPTFRTRRSAHKVWNAA